RSTLAALRPDVRHRRTRAAGHRAGARPRLEPLDDRCLLSADVVLEWNQVLLDTLKADRVLPLFFAREAAIVHAAVYDAVNAIDRSYTPFFAHVHAPRGASLEAAAAQAAHDTMTALFPAHQATFDAILGADLAGIPPGRAPRRAGAGAARGAAPPQHVPGRGGPPRAPRGGPGGPGGPPGARGAPPPRFPPRPGPGGGGGPPLSPPQMPRRPPRLPRRP